MDNKIPATLVKDYANIRFYNPALPDVQDRIVNIVDDVITKYDVDGIHFDDYFYPPKVDKIGFNDSTDFKDMEKHSQILPISVAANVSKVVERISKLIAQKKPGALFSISPASDQTANYNNLYADVTLWCQNGWMDIVMPQIYQVGTTFKDRVHWWPQFSFQAVPMVGYMPQGKTPDQFKYQFDRAALEPKVKGAILYSADIF